MSQAKEITATYLRSSETMEKYIKEFNERKKPGKSHDPFLHALNNPQGQVIKMFEHWFIMINDFPYDNIAETNHMIVTKRHVAFDWKLLTESEKQEFQFLRDTYLKKNYDVIYENLPSGQTQPGRFHLHLLKLKRTSVDDFMKKGK